MEDYGQRAKAFFLWLEQRILQREYTYARMENGRNKELMKAELIEAKQIRDRFAVHMQTPANVPPRAEAATRPAPVTASRAAAIAVEDAVEVLGPEPKRRTLH